MMQTVARELHYYFTLLVSLRVLRLCGAANVPNPEFEGKSIVD
jgi:hypothetical protein